ncbi:MAG: manganese efflux pump [Firmicutes bacterium]|nr:manganese efflux pump [Bacillota bacterium]
MNSITSFIITSAALGVGLAMDAFSVSVANGLKYSGSGSELDRARLGRVPLCFAFFQFIMPLIGWFCVRMIVEAFNAFRPFIPWIALLLLLFIGGQMIMESLKGDIEEKEEAHAGLGFGALMLQGIATSIDALSVGFTISEYHTGQALAASAIIAVVTYFICFIGLKAGTRLGPKLAGRAGLLGGTILIIIGIKVFIEGVF